MIELTKLSKVLLFVFIAFIIYKTKFYMKIIGLGDWFLKKIGYYNNLRAYNKKEQLKRKKYLNKLINKMNKQDEI